MYKRFIIVTILCSLLTVFCWTIGIFVIGIDLILLPIMLGLILVAISGLISVPLWLYKILKKQPISSKLVTLIALSTGFYLGQFLSNPLISWDANQRNISGIILTTEIEKYRSEHGVYPVTLKQLNADVLDEKLPKNYEIDRFSYHLDDDGYDLDIQIPIMDRWHWDRESNQFVYNDF